MDNGFQFLDIILLAAVAGFIFLRLRSVLGRRMGHEQSPPEEQKQRSIKDDKSADNEDNVVTLDGKAKSPFESPFAGTELSRTLTQIRQIDKSFDQTTFASGAQAAYEAIVVAFARGDRSTLKELLADDVYENFETSIQDREDQEYNMSTDIVSIHSADIIDATLEHKEAEVTVKFDAEMISMTKDEDGVVVAGDPMPHRVQELWTFARNLKSRNPNWLLITTRSAN
ncbi:Tim44/TimA family putative adaptor protein [Sneathiella marina]|uniref:Tim44/TimA family putative adaptor protein n=1 Tax=Sneathiella marina TaxID=2950108 RepID=A0ABY4W2I6_9PROT|nr:Tim44/TimA family putative adaptor protein [Sneathiella marina]USG61386.1 Tim44/TimA family putative adaptor protein [Sneathiella marina]